VTRWVPPAHSPLAARDVLAGGAALLGLVRGDPAGAIARDLGASGVLLLDSGTTALRLALAAAVHHRPGTGVALPAYGCYDLATAADGAQADVVLYDLDPDTLGPDPASLRRALDRGVGAVVVVHLFGIPVDVPAVAAMVAGRGTVVIEDAAQAAGGTLGGRPLGSLGTVSVLSFGRGKGITGGGGGALLATAEGDPRCVAWARERIASGGRGAAHLVKLAAQWVLGRPSLYGIPARLPFLGLGETVYHPPWPPAGMTRVAAGVVPGTWAGRGREREIRRRNVEWLRARAPGRFRAPAPPAGAEPGWLRLPFVVAPEDRAAADEPHARRLGIMPGYPLALCDLPGFGGRCVNGGDPFPGARLLAGRLLTLPTHSRVSAFDRERLGRWLDARRG